EVGSGWHFLRAPRIVSCSRPFPAVVAAKRICLERTGHAIHEVGPPVVSGASFSRHSSGRVNLLSLGRRRFADLVSNGNYAEGGCDSASRQTRFDFLGK